MRLPLKSREPDFNRLLKVLKREKTDVPVLFEYFMNDSLYDILTEGEDFPSNEMIREYVKVVKAYKNAGYDFATFVPPADFNFYHRDENDNASVSLNNGAGITSRETLDTYPWPDIKNIDLSILDKIKPYIPEGMKMVAAASDGVEETVIELVGFENFCYMIVDNPNLVKSIFDAVGQRLLDYYTRIVEYDVVGACINNDDWGFNTQTLISHDDMEKWLFPWHKKINDVIHAAGKPVILHSCGNIYPLMDRIIDYLKVDGKHSYEDSIMTVEDAWEKYHDRIAIMGGIDMDFISRAEPEDVYRRSKAMLERTGLVGGFALGTGNSVPEYIPPENFFAMIKAALE